MKIAAFWVLFVGTMAIYLVMVLWSLPQLSAAAGGLAPFDLRFGYTLAEAQQFLAALPPEQNAFYRHTQHLLDLFFPPLWSLMLFFAIAALAPRVIGPWKWVLAALALPLAVFDLLENFAVDRMLTAGADDLTPELANTASQWTTLKAGLTTVVMTLLLVLLVTKGVQLIGRRFGKGAAKV